MIHSGFRPETIHFSRVARKMKFPEQMNIFILSWCIEECARWHFDKHVVKMILELAQLLSTAHWQLSDRKQLESWENDNLIYKQTHVNHPCAKWVREHVNNYRFTAKLAKALCDEYWFRYGKEKNKRHKTERIINHLILNEPVNFTKIKKPLIGLHKVTEPAQAMPEYYKNTDVIQAYQDYYMSEEKSLLTYWKNRDIPEWYS